MRISDWSSDVCSSDLNFYPVVAGYDNEKGAGAGFGYNLNLPMPHGSPESVFFDKLAIAVDAIQVFQPDALVLALGFDIFERDPQAKVAVSSAGFERIGRSVASFGVPVLVVQNRKSTRLDSSH